MSKRDEAPVRRIAPDSSIYNEIQNNDSTVARKDHFPIPDRDQGITAANSKDGRQMDPFEVRIRFTQHLQHLNASVTSANKAAQYALKFRDMDEDLHSCILEQLERVCLGFISILGNYCNRLEEETDLDKNSMNNRANIMFFIEHLCDMAAREGHQDYVRMMQRDILRVVDAVTPENGSGAANVKVVRKVLQGLQQKSFLLAQTVSEIEELLKERDTAADAVGLSSPLQPDVEMTGTTQSTPKSAKTNGHQRLDKKQIEQRIEEDRERHKRLRENIWAIPKASGPEDAGQEFEKLWEETSNLGEDDLILYDEDGDERKNADAECKEEH